MMPSVVVTGTLGALNCRGSSGRFTRKIHTPAHTRMNANSVPMLVMSPTTLSGTKVANAPQKPRKIKFDFHGVRNRRCLTAGYRATTGDRHRIRAG